VGKGRVKQAAEKPLEAVILRSPPFLLADDEGSRIVLKILRARFLASLRMTAWKRFSAACKTPPCPVAPRKTAESHEKPRLALPEPEAAAG
jgi:hypothetical protein